MSEHVHKADNVRVAQLAQGLAFAAEAFQHFVLEGQVAAEHFDSDILAGLRVDAAINRAHGAFADSRFDRVALVQRLA